MCTFLVTDKRSLQPEQVYIYKGKDFVSNEAKILSISDYIENRDNFINDSSLEDSYLGRVHNINYDERSLFQDLSFLDFSVMKTQVEVLSNIVAQVSGLTIERRIEDSFIITLTLNPHFTSEDNTTLVTKFYTSIEVECIKNNQRYTQSMYHFRLDQLSNCVKLFEFMSLSKCVDVYHINSVFFDNRITYK